MPPLVYALVSRGKTVLAEYASTTGNFEQILRLVLPKLELSPEKQSIETETHSFHLLVHQKLFFICLVDKAHPQGTALAFRFLSEACRKFDQDPNNNDVENAIAYSFNAHFGATLGSLMTQINDVSEEDGFASNLVSKVRGQLEDVKDVMRTNIDSLLNRGDRIEMLVESTERLTQASFKFQETATKLRNQMWWNSAKYKMAMGAGGLFFFLFFYYFLFT